MAIQITQILGLLFNIYIFWIIYQLYLAAWAKRKAKEKWLTVVKSPFFQIFPIKPISLILFIALTIQVAMLLILTGVSIYTGNPISIEG
jgi:hypothetical protein